MLSILYPFAKLKIPLRATALCVRGSAQSPIAIEAALTSRPARPRHAPFGVTLCPWSRGTLLGLPLRTDSVWKEHIAYRLLSLAFIILVVYILIFLNMLL